MDIEFIKKLIIHPKMRVTDDKAQELVDEILNLRSVIDQLEENLGDLKAENAEYMVKFNLCRASRQIDQTETIELAKENAELKAAQEWQPIEASLPDLLTPVFLLNTGSIWNAPDEMGEVLEMTQGYLNNVRGQKYWSIFGMRGGSEINGYTHWQPLPQSPKGGDDEVS